MTNRVKVGSDFTNFRNNIEYNILIGNIKLTPLEITKGFCYLSEKYQEGKFYSALIEENHFGAVSMERVQISRDGFVELPITGNSFRSPKPKGQLALKL